MSNGQRDPLWEELGRIDFFLEHLARAVERGEAPLATYETLAPRYLARREELVGAIERRTVRVAPPSAATPAATPGPESGVVPAGVPATGRAIPPASPPKHNREVRWTQVLAYTGAFLVVVAAAIFTVAVWETVSTTAKLAFLGVFTAAFYGAGVLVWRAGLHGGGVALTAVGSAMLLFDGWIAIDGYGLAGPWPWAALLLVLSAVYWFTETRLAGRFFGVTGAAAQVGWWWLLGQGLGWTEAPRLAGIAAVALGWSLAADAVAERKEFASLARVLRVAAPITAAVAAAGILVDLAIGPPGWTELISAAVAALAVTGVFDRVGRAWRGLAALGWIPLMVSTAAMLDRAPVGWGHVALLAFAAIVTGAYELWRGGTGHGIAALLFEVGAWLVLAERLGFAEDATLSLLVVVAAVWFAASRLMSVRPALEEPFSAHAIEFARTAAAGGWLLLLGLLLYLPDALYGASRSGWALAVPREAVLAAIYSLGWAVGARLMRAWPAAIVAIAGSFLTVGLLVTGLFPDLHAAYVACSLVAVAALWLHIPRAADAISAPLAGRVTSWIAGAMLLGFAVALWFSGPVHAEVPLIALLLALSALWASEALRGPDGHAGAPAALTLVAAAVVTGDLIDAGGSVLGSGLGGVTGALAGVVLCGAVALLVRVRGGARRGEPWAAAASAAATAAALWPSVTLVAPRGPEIAPYLAAGLALAALAWAVSAIALRRPWVALASALTAWAALLACLSWAAVAPGVTFAALTGFSLVLFAPTFLIARDAADSSGSPPSSSFPYAAPLAVAALFVTCGTVFLGMQSASGLSLWHRWAAIGEWGLAGAFATLGSLLVLAAAPYRAEVAEYLGAAAFVAAGWTVLNAVDVTVLEPYLVLLALYIAGSSYRYASRAPLRTVPPAADWAAVICAAWLPALLAVSANTPADAFTHAVWAVGLSLAAIAAGILLRVRGYLFGGVSALVFVSVWRSFFLLVEFWWVVLGLIGIVMLVIALTWERQQLLLARTGEMVREYLGGWR